MTLPRPSCGLVIFNGCAPTATAIPPNRFSNQWVPISSALTPCSPTGRKWISSSATRRFWATKNCGQVTAKGRTVGWGTHTWRNSANISKEEFRDSPTCVAIGLKKRASILPTANASAPACWRRKGFAGWRIEKCSNTSRKPETFSSPSATVNGFSTARTFTSAWSLSMTAAKRKSHFTLDGRSVKEINPNLTQETNVVDARRLSGNEGFSFIGSCKGGSFDIVQSEALMLLHSGGNANLRPNSDVIRPVANSDDLLKSHRSEEHTSELQSLRHL